MDKLIQEAERIVKQSKLDKKSLLMIGHPIEDKPKDPTATAPVESKCSDCSLPVWSTELKEKIISLAPDAKVLCGTCLVRVLREENQKIVS